MVIEERSYAKRMIGHCVLTGRQDLMEKFVEDYNHYDAVYEYMMKKEFTYEDRYSSEENV